MPQFDPALFAPQIIWLIIAFGGLWLLLARIALPRVERAMIERSEQIAADLDAARGMRAEAQAIADAQAAKLAEARARAAATAERTRTEIRARTDKALGALNAQLNEKVMEAEGRIAAEAETAIAGIGPAATEVAAEIIASLIGGKMDMARIGKTVDAAREQA